MIQVLQQILFAPWFRPVWALEFGIRSIGRGAEWWGATVGIRDPLLLQTLPSPMLLQILPLSFAASSLHGCIYLAMIHSRSSASLTLPSALALPQAPIMWLHWIGSCISSLHIFFVTSSICTWNSSSTHHVPALYWIFTTSFEEDANKDFTTQLTGCSCVFSFFIICSHVFLNVREGSFISWKPINGLQ